MKNIEIKASYRDLNRARAIARQLAAEPHGVLDQLDTYFRVPVGRLKLRETGTFGSMMTAELIFYRRADEARARESDYDVVPVNDPTGLKRALDRAIGTWRTIAKRRELWMLDNVRIHLDEVEGLGNFVELEAVVDRSHPAEACSATIDRLAAAFGIQAGERIAESYSDLL